jgi:hypothetical protein
MGREPTRRETVESMFLSSCSGTLGEVKHHEENGEKDEDLVVLGRAACSSRRRYYFEDREK